MSNINNGKYPKDEINNTIIEFLGGIMNPDERDIEFWNKFMNGEYEPGIIFEECIANELKNHPVALYTLNSLKSNVNNQIIDGVTIYSDLRKENHFVKCHINGEQQMGVKISEEDYIAYRNQKISKEELAHIYHVSSLNDMINNNSNNKNIKR